MAGGTVIEVLQERDFFGEEGAVLKAPYLFGLRASEETSVLQIPGELLNEVPSLCWKLLDSHHKRTIRSVYGGERKGGIVWRDMFTINVAQMDRQHMRLVEMGNAIIVHLEKDTDRGCLVRVLNALVEYTRYHCDAEEELMKLYQYSDADTHCSKHKALVREVAEYAEQAGSGPVPERTAFMRFFEKWLAQHILDEDLKYGEFLNTKGVY